MFILSLFHYFIEKNDNNKNNNMEGKICLLKLVFLSIYACKELKNLFIQG